MSTASDDIQKTFDLAAMEDATAAAIRAAALEVKDFFASDEARIRAAHKMSGSITSVDQATARELVRHAMAHADYSSFLKPPPTEMERYAQHVRAQNQSFGLKRTDSGPTVDLPGTPAGMPYNPASVPQPEERPSLDWIHARLANDAAQRDGSVGLHRKT